MILEASSSYQQTYDVDRCKSRLQVALESVKEAQGYYTEGNKTIIIHIDLGSSDIVREKLFSEFEYELTKGHIQLVEQEDDLCYLIYVGAKLLKQSDQNQNLYNSDESNFHPYDGSVAMLAVNRSDQTIILTAKHLFSRERSHQEETGVFLSDTGPEIRTVSNSYAGVLSVLEREINGHVVEFGVDIAALPLLPEIQNDVQFNILHNTKAAFTGPDIDLLHRRVKKYGATTGETCGLIVKTDYTLTGQSFRNELTGTYFVIKPEFGNFAEPGDSGALIWDEDGVPLGVLSMRKRMVINGIVDYYCLCCRLDICLIALKKHWPKLCDITGLRAYRPYGRFSKRSFTSPYSDLCTLTKGVFKQVTSVPVTCSHDVTGSPKLRYVHGMLYLCNGAMQYFDENLQELQSNGLTDLDNLQVRDIAPLPDGEFLIVAQIHLYYTLNKGSVNMIEEKEIHEYKTAQYHSNHIYALQHQDPRVTVFMQSSSNNGSWEVRRTVSLNSDLLSDFWISFDGIRALSGKQLVLISDMTGIVKNRQDLQSKSVKHNEHTSVSSLCQEDIHGNCLCCCSNGQLLVWLNDSSLLQEIQIETPVQASRGIYVRNKLYVLTVNNTLEMFTSG